MVTVQANIITFWLRCILLLAFALMNYVALQRYLSGAYSDPNKLFAFRVGLPIFLFFFFSILASLFSVYRVSLNLVERCIGYQRITGNRRISLEELEGYYLASFRTKMYTYEGIMVSLTDGRVIELNEYNLDSLFEFNQALIELGVPFLGQKKSWFPLTFWR